MTLTESVNTNVNWKFGINGELKELYVDDLLTISGDVIVSSISIDDILRITSGIVDNILFKSTNINDSKDVKDIDNSNTIIVEQDVSINSEIEIEENIVMTSDLKDLNDEFLESTITDSDLDLGLQHLDISSNSNTLFNEIQYDPNNIEVSFIINE
tara:strand:- start:743 stop:1210 length:468 start_codon:yes stop_codon:yes gene_type:complete